MFDEWLWWYTRVVECRECKMCFYTDSAHPTVEYLATIFKGVPEYKKCSHSGEFVPKELRKIQSTSDEFNWVAGYGPWPWETQLNTKVIDGYFRYPEEVRYDVES